MGDPSWNLTPFRRLKVHTDPFLVGFHAVANIGFSCNAWLSSKARNSPVWASMHSPPASETLSGLMAAAGAWVPSFSVPPFVGVPDAEPDEEADEELLLAPPQAARIAPTIVLDIPITALLRMNWRRLRRPATSSSM